MDQKKTITILRRILRDEKRATANLRHRLMDEERKVSGLLKDHSNLERAYKNASEALGQSLREIEDFKEARSLDKATIESKDSELTRLHSLLAAKEKKVEDVEAEIGDAHAARERTQAKLFQAERMFAIAVRQLAGGDPV